MCRGISEVLQRAGIAPGEVDRVVHGTTLATNVVLQRDGARVAFVTTAGFGDMLRLGREARVEEDRYDLMFTKPAPPVDHRFTLEVDERVAADGTVVTALSTSSVERLMDHLDRLQPEAIAICLVNAHVNDTHERLVAEACRRRSSGRFIAASSEVWPEMREFDRAMTTVMSAYVGPRLADYLAGLESDLVGIGLRCPVDIMESSGGVISAQRAAARPIYTVESGGAAGVSAAGAIGKSAGVADVISFDMGGTTAKAGVLRNGRADITHDFQLGGKGSYGSVRAGTGFPLKIPVVDLAEVGAGGGSVAWIDAGGVLRVGPRSSGAVPGPACYGQGGTLPTVTDANLVLGYLDAERIADGVRLDRSAAERAVESVARPLGLDVVEAARAIHEVANAGMATAIRVVTIQRGIDPRAFALVGFGGAGPLHAGHLADSFEIGTVIIPEQAGVASAIGLLDARPTAHSVRAYRWALDSADADRIESVLSELATNVAADLQVTDGEESLRVHRQADIRHVGQAHQLTVDITDDPLTLGQLDADFRGRYLEEYGLALDAPLELVQLRVTVTRMHAAREHPALRADGPDRAAPIGARDAWFAPEGMTSVDVFDWSQLPVGFSFDGPALVHGEHTTAVIPGTRTVVVDRERSLVMSLSAGRPDWNEASRSIEAR